MDKQVIREMFLARRKQLDKTLFTMFNTLLLSKVRATIKQHNFKHVAYFYPMGNEVDLRALKDAGVTLYLPKVTKTGLVFYKDTGSYVKAPFNTTVPSHDEAVDLSLLDCVIVPGIVYDLNRYRIGYGKAYYDRFLKDYQGFKLGVCFDLFVLSSIPKDDHDIAVDVLVTDQRIIGDKNV